MNIKGSVKRKGFQKCLQLPIVYQRDASASQRCPNETTDSRYLKLEEVSDEVDGF